MIIFNIFLKKGRVIEKVKVLVIIPAFNEEKNIINVIHNLSNNNEDIDYLIINDCSKDNTLELCKKNNFNYISFPINLGIGGGVQAGYKYALEHHYDIAIQHDGDGQHDSKYIKEVMRPIIEQNADIVIGSRFLKKEGFQSSSMRRFGINFLSTLIFLCSGVKIKDVTSGFRAVNKEYIKFYAEEYPQDYPEPEAIVAAKMNGARITEIPVVMKERENGVSSINFKRSLYYMFKVSLAIIICRITHRRKK